MTEPKAPNTGAVRPPARTSELPAAPPPDLLPAHCPSANRAPELFAARRRGATPVDCPPRCGSKRALRGA